MAPSVGSLNSAALFHVAPFVQSVAGRGVMLGTALGFGFREVLRFGVAPHALMQVWFVATVLLTVFGTSPAVYVIDLLRYVGVPRRATQRVCAWLMCSAFRVCCWLNPQVKMNLRMADGEDGKPLSWSDVPAEGIAIALNHTSFWDIFEFIDLIPMRLLLNTRTLMKDSLRKIPIFGGVFDRVGHFPVFFKSDEDGNFQVDRDRQAVVQKDVNAHIAQGGSIAIFPEGAVNKRPEKLQMFRFGTFATIVEHRMPLYYMVAVGNERTWSATGMGGLPATIEVRFGKYPVDFETADSKQLAQEMHTFMQKVYDETAAEMAGKESKKDA